MNKILTSIPRLLTEIKRQKKKTGFFKAGKRDSRPACGLPHRSQKRFALNRWVCRAAFRIAQKNKSTALRCFYFLEVTPGFEPGNQGFADPCLTTWLCHQRDSLDCPYRIPQIARFVKTLFRGNPEENGGTPGNRAGGGGTAAGKRWKKAPAEQKKPEPRRKNWRSRRFTPGGAHAIITKNGRGARFCGKSAELAAPI